MTDQQKLLRLLKLITLLGSTRKRTAREYADKFEISLATIHRHLNLLRDAGFDIQKDEHHCHYLLKPGDSTRSALHFTVEEAQELQIMVKSFSSPLQQSLLNKIYAGSELAENVYSIVKARIAQNYKQLSHAITAQKQVVLRQYFSENSKETKDRKVEPIQLDNEKMLLIAYEIGAQKSKHFKLDRIEEVNLLNAAFKYTRKHGDGTPIDPFGIVDAQRVQVVLQLSELARHRLLERFQDCASFIRKDGKECYFEGEVNAGFKIMDRFLLSYCDEIIILQPSSLKDHLQNIWKKKKL